MHAHLLGFFFFLLFCCLCWLAWLNFKVIATLWHFLTEFLAFWHWPTLKAARAVLDDAVFLKVIAFLGRVCVKIVFSVYVSLFVVWIPHPCGLLMSSVRFGRESCVLSGGTTHPLLQHAAGGENWVRRHGLVWPWPQYYQKCFTNTSTDHPHKPCLLGKSWGSLRTPLHERNEAKTVE